VADLRSAGVGLVNLQSLNIAVHVTALNFPAQSPLFNSPTYIGGKEYGHAPAVDNPAGLRWEIFIFGFPRYAPRASKYGPYASLAT
jgi:hypothetical protein